MQKPTRPRAIPTVQADDERVRVTRWDFAPGAETGWHRHGMAYVVVPLTLCRIALEEPGGRTREVTIEAGASYSREAGIEQNVVNGGTEAMSFVEIEMKAGREA